KAKERMDMDDNERAARMIQEQVERGMKAERNAHEAEYTELKRDNEEEKVTICLGTSKKTELPKPVPVENVFKGPSGKEDNSQGQKDSKKLSTGDKRKSALDEIMEHEEKMKEKKNRKDYWLHEGIVVKVISKKLGDKYYKKKGYVKSVQDVYGAIIKMIDSGDKIKVDQSHVETVLPATGKLVLIVNGAYRGDTAMLEEINEKKFNCSVKLSSGPLNGRLVENLAYEDVSKLYQAS
ncbi:hypothetical protein DPMN_120800, partial [Dreissena polymorpha]